MSETLKFGNGQWATKVGSTLAYNDENGNFKPLPFNFTRSTGGTRVNKDGLIEVVTNNKPRIDFLNDSNGALLLEPTRSNLVPYSQEFTGWQLTNVVETPNDLISPDGAQNASKFVTNANGVDIKYASIPVVQNTTYTFSFYCNYIGGLGLQGRFYDNTNGANIEYYDYMSQLEEGKWKRVTRTFTTPIGCTNIQVWYLAASSSNPVTAYYWGAQLEAGSYATSYIPTQGATATRVAEVCSQTPPSGIIGQTEGTIFAHFKRNGNIVSRGGVVFLREDFLRGLSINYINNTLYAISRNDAATTTVVLKTPFDINETAKVAITYNGSVFSGFLNGVKIFTDSVFNPFDTIVTEIRVSYGANSGSDIEIAPNSMKDVRVYTTVLTDQECINLTTL
jgi:hypothetical protein